MKAPVIAIDGPAGAGKSTVAKRLAAELGLRYLDTGAMYRCLALAARRAGLGPEAGQAAADLAATLQIQFAEGAAGSAQRVLLNGEDVSEAIRTPEIGELASALSAHSPVRRVLVALQKAIVAQGGCTLEGRDTTTVVAPDADVLVFLTADLETRAQRRLAEFQAKDPSLTLDQVKEMISIRDERDSTRADSPLSIAPNAIVIDTSGMEIEEVVSAVRKLVAGKG